LALARSFCQELLAGKCPHSAREFLRQKVFPAQKRNLDPRSGVERRHHLHESGLQKAVKVAADGAGITKRVGCHKFRHSFATNMFEDGHNIKVVQELMGRADVKVNEIYKHVMEKEISPAIEPLDTI